MPSVTSRPSVAPSTATSTLRPGAEGADVEALQQLLNDNGFSVGEVDGNFGSGTTAAVKQFQASRGLTADGVVGRGTWAALRAGSTEPTPAPAPTGSSPKLRQGDSGAAVEELQQLLAAKGERVSRDGTFGAGTAAAVKSFQAANGLLPDGVVGAATWRALREDGAMPVRPVNPQPSPQVGTPPKFFAFASPDSEYGKFLGGSENVSHDNGLTAREVNALVSKYGPNVLVGFDQGTLSSADVRALQRHNSGAISNPALKAAVEQGARLHAYTGGPSGVTGADWTDEEAAATIVRARSVGITVHNPRNENEPGMREWNTRGYREYTWKQLGEYKKAGIESAEIDNLSNDPSIRETGSGLVKFYEAYQQRFNAGQLPKLLPKNLTGEQWSAVKDAIDSGRLSRGMFSDFAITEVDDLTAAQTREQIAGARAVGITLTKSFNTQHYAAFGEFNAPT